MYAICVESSQQRGMGHLFRAFNLIDFFQDKAVVFVNDNAVAIKLLQERKVRYEVVALDDYTSDWESGLIGKYQVTVWLNDRLDTDVSHAKNVVKNKVKLVTFDDNGSGASVADFNILATNFTKSTSLKGKKILQGIKYLVLNKQIDESKRVRKELNKIIVTLGGSDTYGVTLQVASFLQKLALKEKVTIIIGPSFAFKEELYSRFGADFLIKDSVPSLIEEFYHYDLAITGGGITPFEANASGLPCIIVANELWEIDNALFLHKLGSALFAGYYKEIVEGAFSQKLALEKMSMCGLQSFDTLAVERIFEEIDNG